MFKLMVVTQLYDDGAAPFQPVVTVIDFGSAEEADVAEEKMTAFSNARELQGICVKQVVTKLYK